MTQVEAFKVESDERGFELHICVDEEPHVDGNGWMVLNCHAMAPEILQEVKRTIGEWWAEGQAVKADFERGRRARAEYDREVYNHERQTGQHAPFECAPEDVDESGGLAQAFGFDSQEELDAFARDAYDRSDPKHPTWHSTHADIWDSREGK